MDSKFNYFQASNEAKKELEAIQILSQKLRTSTPEAAYKIYCKITEQDMFHSPIGMDFMKKLEEYLVLSGVLEVKTKAPKEPEKQGKKVLEQLNQTKNRLSTSLILNGILIIAILVMIYIASTSSNINILNYETALQDRYSSWEQDLKNKEKQLKEREAAVARKEAELNIQTETD